MYKVHCLVVEKQWEKSKKLWFHQVFFYFVFFIEFLIELLKKIETLLFFEFELVCGFDFFFFFFFFWVLFCALFCSWVELLISGKFHTQILNYALFCSDDVRAC